ncbi:hypothetical protein EV193_110170 [Herbihabitans rhizosphaerae]|uniref:Lipoprotein n=1 Tax=Herbihabitans rhizosphaerae TaxID=1872711 RepID=A0A4Q7KGP1_9PSEU|nr:hypothetical protein [Herbihabitans rhizosphaerae]RZS34020.1 hypothetical protein EV193_110170 [Herbihabitans rhizosphaerae]
MRKIAVIVSSLALAVTLGACGGETSGNASAASGTPAPGQPNPGGGDALADTSALASAVDKQANGKQSVHAEVKAEPVGVSGKGQLRFGSNPGMAMTMNTPEGEQQMVMVADGVYTTANEAMRQQGVTTKWVKFARGGEDPGSKLFTALADLMVESSDVTKQVEKAKASGRIIKTAKEQIDGQPTTRYTIEADVAKLVENEKNALAKLGMQLMLNQGVKTLPFDFWLNNENLPVQVVNETPAIAGQPAIKTTAKYSNWGAPVQITVPPANEVGDPPKVQMPPR